VRGIPEVADGAVEALGKFRARAGMLDQGSEKGVWQGHRQQGNAGAGRHLKGLQGSLAKRRGHLCNFLRNQLHKKKELTTFMQSVA
jgi:hypothetical protein